MMTKDEALLMALLALEMYVPYYIKDGGCKAIQACKEALEQEPLNLNCKSVQKRLATQWGYVEQPAQEPVACMKSALDNARDVCKYLDHDMIKEAKAHTKFFWNDLDKIRDFDATHPAQEPECSNHPDAPHGFCRDASHSAGRYVCECEGWEAEQQSQEPVAWGNPTYNYAVHHKVAPSWQGLSDDEKLAIIRKWKDAHTMREQELIGLGDAIEQALKEKNHG